MQSINLLFKTCRRFPIFLGHPDALLSSSRPFHHDHPLINTSTPAPLSTHLLFPRGHPPFPIHHRPCLSLCTLNPSNSQVRRMEDFFEVARLAGRTLAEPQFQVAVRDWAWFEIPGRNSMSTSHDIGGGTLGISNIPYFQLFDSARLPVDALVPLSSKARALCLESWSPHAPFFHMWHSRTIFQRQFCHFRFIQFPHRTDCTVLTDPT